MWAYGQSPDIRSGAECERCPGTAIVREVTTDDEIRRVFALCSNVADTDGCINVERDRQKDMEIVKLNTSLLYLQLG